jgi:hypothetical protein
VITVDIDEVKQSVAYAYNLPDSWADRLKGATEDELHEDASNLREELEKLRRTKLTLADIQSMSVEEVSERWEEVQTVLSGL